MSRFQNRPRRRICLRWLHNKGFCDFEGNCIFFHPKEYRERPSRNFDDTNPRNFDDTNPRKFDERSFPKDHQYRREDERNRRRENHQNHQRNQRKFTLDRKRNIALQSHYEERRPSNGASMDRDFESHWDSATADTVKEPKTIEVVKLVESLMTDMSNQLDRIEYLEKRVSDLENYNFERFSKELMQNPNNMYYASGSETTRPIYTTNSGKNIEESVDQFEEINESENRKDRDDRDDRDDQKDDYENYDESQLEYISDYEN